jgi:transcription-repair coupling factor (superfamily II helicase)
MDRLVCGDVGYGKTEVAIRAAFKATQDGKQVMVLCPTTILAQQHYTTFSERFAPFPVRVEVLSRFRTRAQQAAALEGFAAGTVDVLIGTHRLLSRDVVPRDLGLVIIDEEQRFGVEHKEHLKHLREQVDVLTLTATPIPRTLQMSLSGVRDFSVIDTPPPNRFPVTVHVGEYDPDVVAGAIRRELERGGQVYYISNRVRGIERAVERVRAAVPEARIGVAHGQLSEHQLERVMESFAAGETDVLVSTTIVESGIDNPHTNTLIIEDSQRLGLAQLYQLKGRVGRSHVKAYAYFLFPRNAMLTDTAYERLAAIQEHADLGSGIKLAMRDLEIRGAGSLLGAEQSGNVSAVGFDLYAQMLREALAEARGEPQPARLEVRVDLPVAAFLPEEYVADVDERVLAYRRIAAAASPDAVEAIAADLAERFGQLPPPAEELLAIARIKALAAELGVTNVHLARGRVSLGPIALEPSARLVLAREHKAVWSERTRAIEFPATPGVSPTAAALGALGAILGAVRAP